MLESFEEKLISFDFSVSSLLDYSKELENLDKQRIFYRILQIIGEKKRKDF